MSETRTETLTCDCGRATGERCAWSGPIGEMSVVEWMPEHLRASHMAAGNSGSWPHNGAERILVERTCADRLVDSEGAWCSIVRDATAADALRIGGAQ